MGKPQCGECKLEINDLEPICCGFCGNLHIYYQNVRGLRKKIEDFFLAVSELDYDVIVLTET